MDEAPSAIAGGALACLRAARSGPDPGELSDGIEDLAWVMSREQKWVSFGER
jgi:hypothetical protein